jgi:hypothetical protein
MSVGSVASSVITGLSFQGPETRGGSLTYSPITARASCRAAFRTKLLIEVPARSAARSMRNLSSSEHVKITDRVRRTLVFFGGFALFLG